MERPQSEEKEKDQDLPLPDSRFESGCGPRLRPGLTLDWGYY